MPNSVTSIGYYAFSGCDGLTSVNIGNGVKSIGEDFAYCKELTDVYCYADKIPSAEAGAFSYSNIWNATLHVRAASSNNTRQLPPGLTSVRLFH
ncbi:MAG: leucine-rich repeat protein [Bacteroidaceae bacterium]|nr:leucine-rich repeat protein [Bacteroidaceae bacterium]